MIELKENLTKIYFVCNKKSSKIIRKKNFLIDFQLKKKKILNFFFLNFIDREKSFLFDFIIHNFSFQIIFDNILAYLNFFFYKNFKVDKLIFVLWNDLYYIFYHFLKIINVFKLLLNKKKKKNFKLNNKFSKKLNLKKIIFTKKNHEKMIEIKINKHEELKRQLYEKDIYFMSNFLEKNISSLNNYLGFKINQQKFQIEQIHDQTFGNLNNLNRIENLLKKKKKTNNYIAQINFFLFLSIFILLFFKY
jgi:hypothetical protein